MTIINFIIFNLILYSIIGWLIEGLYSYVVSGSFNKERFMKGPYKPMYGIAFTILVLCDKYLNINIVLKFILYFIVPTAVEFISGYLLKEMFNKQYWDYSNLKMNYKGLITLRFSFYWFVLCYIGLNVVQPIINSIYLSLEKGFRISNLIFSFVIIFDLIITIKSLYRSLAIQN